MADLAQLEAALVKADAAGNTEDARVLAAEIRRVRAEQPSLVQPRVQRTTQPYGHIPGKDPTQGMGTVAKANASFVGQLESFGRGVGQLLQEGALVNSKIPLTPEILAAHQRTIAESQANEARHRGIMAPVDNTGAGFLGKFGGALAPFLAPGIAAARYGEAAPALATAARSVALPSTIRGATAQGGLMGLMQPTVEGESRLVNAGVGAGAGLVGTTAPRVITGAYRALTHPIHQASRPGVNRRVAEVLRTEAERPERIMAPAPSGVPGAQRSLAEETRDAGIARLERNSRSTEKGWTAFDSANNSRRVEALRTVGGTPEQIAAAEAARDTASKSAKAAAMRVRGVDTSRLISQLDRASARLQGRTAVQDAIGEVRDLLSQPGADSVATLYNVRKTIDDMLSGRYAGRGGSARAASAELMMAKAQLDRVIAKNAPAFKDYLAAYKDGSVPINRMQLGNELLKKGAGSRITDEVGDPVLTPAAFAGATADLNKTAAAATGFRKAKADQILRPQDQRVIASVQDDLNRRAFAARAGSGGGSPTFERGALDARMRSTLAAKIPGLKWGLEELERMGQQRMEAKLAEVLMNPVRARELLASVPEQDRRVLESAIRRVGGPAASAVALELSR
jgi:hypothetical protein